MNQVALKSRDSGRKAPAAMAGPGQGFRYWAFLSYPHEDSRAADRLHRALEQFRTPAPLVGRPHPLGTIPPRLAPIFRDRQELAASSDLSRTIREALSQSRYFIVLCSPAAAASPWVDQEIRDFKKIHGEDRVLAAIVDGEPFAAERGEDAAECFPPSLRQRVDSRGRLTSRRAEPIAADLRDNADGWRIGQLKLVAGMLGVGLDDLVQREQMRRQRRMTWIAAASLAGMAVTSGLAAVAIDARDSARDERREAEGLVEFMLGDLREELEPIGRLDALDQVGGRALAYFERQDKDDLSDEQLAQRSQALGLLGEIAMSRGDLSGAAARYREAMRGTSELVERFPNDPQRLWDHAQNVFWMGEIAIQRGDLGSAERSMRDYARLAERMVAAEPTNRKWQMEIQMATANLGTVLYKQRRFAEASRYYQQALERIETLVAAEPGNRDYQSAMSQTLAWLGDSQYGEGLIVEAIGKRERQVALLEQLAQKRGDVEFRRLAIPARRALGRLLASHGEVAAGVAMVRSGIAIGERLIAAEPTNAAWQHSIAAARLDLARILLATGQSQQASPEIRTACEVAERLAIKDRGNASWRQLSFDCLLDRSKLALALGSAEEARALSGRAVAAARTLASGNAEDDRAELARGLFLLGEAEARLGERAAAERAWRSSLGLWPQPARQRPRETAYRAETLRRLGLADQAGPLERHLAGIGYRRLV